MPYDYDVLYSMNTQAEAAAAWAWVAPSGNTLQATGTAAYWCWTDTGSASSGTGPPTGVPCVYAETSSPAAVGNVYTMTLAVALSAAQYGLYVTFNVCKYANTSAAGYFEAWNGTDWIGIANWFGTTVTTFVSLGPYDFTGYTNSDFKIRFRIVVGGTAYQNDFAVDEVRIYGDVKVAYVISGVTRDKDGAILGGCEVTLFKTDAAIPPNYTQIDKTTSDAVTGAYSFPIYDQDALYMIYAIKDNTPHVFDATDNVLQGV